MSKIPMGRNSFFVTIRRKGETSKRKYSTSKSKIVGQLLKLDTFKLDNAYHMDMGVLQKYLFLPDIFNGPKCPIITPPPVEWMEKIIKQFIPDLKLGKSYSAFSSKTNLMKSGHLYTHIACVGTIQNIAQTMDIPEDLVKVVMSHPAFYPLFWAGSMPYGGVIVNASGNPEFRSEVIGESRFLLTKGQDPIRFTGHTSIPRELSSGIKSFGSYFLAQTEYGHALTGSVLHYMLVTGQGQVVCMWIGGGVGMPVVGGHLNNIVALHDGHGIWPAMVRNMTEVLKSREAFSILQAPLVNSSETADLKKIIHAVNQWMELQHRHRHSSYALGEFLNYDLGNIQRTVSTIWGGSGGILKGE